MTIAQCENTGSKPIGQVYNNNFTTIDTRRPVRRQITVPWQMTRAARGGGQASGAARGTPPVRCTCRRARRQSSVRALALRAMARSAAPADGQARQPQGTRSYSKSTRSADVLGRSRVWREAKDNDTDRDRRTGAGVHITGDRPLTRFGYWSIRTVVYRTHIDLNIEPASSSRGVQV